MSGQQSRPPQSLIAQAKTRRPHRKPSDADTAGSRPSRAHHAYPHPVAGMLTFRNWNLARPSCQPLIEDVFIKSEKKKKKKSSCCFNMIGFFSGFDKRKLLLTGPEERQKKVFTGAQSQIMSLAAAEVIGRGCFITTGLGEASVTPRLQPRKPACLVFVCETWFWQRAAQPTAHRYSNGCCC